MKYCLADRLEISKPKMPNQIFEILNAFLKLTDGCSK